MKSGDLVTFKDPTYLSSADLYDEERSRDLYPWKFEVGIIIDAEPRGSFCGKEVYVSWPSDPHRTVLIKHLELVYQ